MEELKPYTSATAPDDLRMDDLRASNVPNDPEDVDFVMEHLNDPNFNLSRPPSSLISDVEPHLESDSHSTSKAGFKNPTAIDFDESVFIYSPYRCSNNTHRESPYPDVRAAVASVDDPLMPVNTFRMWFLGIIFVLFTSGLNQVFNFRCITLP